MDFYFLYRDAYLTKQSLYSSQVDTLLFTLTLSIQTKATFKPIVLVLEVSGFFKNKENRSAFVEKNRKSFSIFGNFSKKLFNFWELRRNFVFRFSCAVFFRKLDQFLGGMSA